MARHILYANGRKRDGCIFGRDGCISGYDRRIARRRAHDITGPVNAWTRFRSHRDLSVEGVMCLDLDFLARRHLDDRRDALVPAVVSHKLNDERSVWRPA